MDSNENKATFKTAFKGFDKKDVVEYIRELSARYDEELKSKTTEVRIGSAKLSKAEDKNRDLEFQLLEKATENAGLKAELEATEMKLSELEKENLALKEKISGMCEPSEGGSDKELLESEVRRLTDELSTAVAESEKAKLEIADIVIKAEQISRKLRDEAIADANHEKEAIERQIVSKKSELMGINGEIERMKSVFSDLYKKYVKD